MNRGSAVKVLNFLIITSLIAGLLVGALVVVTVIGPNPVISIGSVHGAYLFGRTQLVVPLTVNNGGLLDLSNVVLRANVTDSAGDLIIKGASPLFSVSPRSSADENITFQSGLSAIPMKEMGALLVSNQSLTLTASLEAGIYPLTRVTGSIHGIVPWGALMARLTLGSLTVAPHNSTFSVATWTYSFTNSNQYFHLDANVSGEIVDQSGKVIGRIISTPIDVKRGTSFQGTLGAYILTSSIEKISKLGTADLFVDSQGVFVARIQVALNG